MIQHDVDESLNHFLGSKNLPVGTIEALPGVGSSSWAIVCLDGEVHWASPNPNLMPAWLYALSIQAQQEIDQKRGQQLRERQSPALSGERKPTVPEPSTEELIQQVTIRTIEALAHQFAKNQTNGEPPHRTPKSEERPVNGD